MINQYINFFNIYWVMKIFDLNNYFLSDDKIGRNLAFGDHDIVCKLNFALVYSGQI
jgi:hypothetical protein